MRWIILDAWGVIYPPRDDVSALLIPFVQEKDPSVDPQRVRELYISAALGELSARQLWTQLGLGGQYPRIEQEYLDGRPMLDPEFIPAAEELAKRYPLAMLSNDIAPWSRHLRNRFDIERFFKTCLVSGEVGMRKPDERIFRLLLDRLGARAGDCVFIDDRLRNLRVAAMLGLRTVWLNRIPMPADESCAGVVARSLGELPALVEEILS